MEHIKTWRLLGNLTESEMRWLYKTNFEVEIERDVLEVITFGSKLSQSIPTIPKVFIKTRSIKYETLLELQFAGRLFLEREEYYDKYHGCNIWF